MAGIRTCDRESQVQGCSKVCSMYSAIEQIGPFICRNWITGSKLEMLISSPIIMDSQLLQQYLSVVVWHSGSVLVSINEVNQRRVLLVLGWVTMSGAVPYIYLCNQLPKSTQQ